MDRKSMVIAAAMAGILGSGVLVAGCNSAGSSGQSHHESGIERHACKGMNSCKGMGGCKTDSNACKGQNACKGMGGCSTQ